MNTFFLILLQKYFFTQDVDECSDGTAQCGLNAECENEEGSYRCTCLAGYLRDENGVCIGKYQ